MLTNCTALGPSSGETFGPDTPIGDAIGDVLNATQHALDDTFKPTTDALSTALTPAGEAVEGFLNASSHAWSDLSDLTRGLLNASSHAWSDWVGGGDQPLLNTTQVDWALSQQPPLRARFNLTNLSVPYELSDALTIVPEEQARLFFQAGLVFTLTLLIYVLTLCLLRKHDERCVERVVVLTREATVALRHSSGLVLLALVVALGQLLLLGFCGLVLLALVAEDSVKESVHESVKTESESGGSPFEHLGDLGWEMPIWISGASSILTPTHTKLAQGAYVAFTLLWSYVCLGSILGLVISAAVYRSVFVDGRTGARCDERTEGRPTTMASLMSINDESAMDWPVVTQLLDVVRYHLGTAAFGSLVLTVVMPIQV